MAHITRAQSYLPRQPAWQGLPYFIISRSWGAGVCLSVCLTVQQGAKLKRRRQIFIATSPSRFRLLTASKLLHSKSEKERECARGRGRQLKDGRQPASQANFCCRLLPLALPVAFAHLSHILLFWAHLSYARCHFILLA